MGLINKVDMVCLSPVGYALTTADTVFAMKMQKYKFIFS